MSNRWPITRLNELLKLQDNSVRSTRLNEINLAGIYSFGRGLFKRGPMSPGKTTYKSYNCLVTDDFVISQPKAWEGALARVTSEFEGWYLSPVFPTFRPDRSRLDPQYLEWFCKREPVWTELQLKSRGIGARRESVSPDQFLSLEIPTPPLAEQRRIVGRIEELFAKIEQGRELREQAAAEMEALWTTSLRAELIRRGCEESPLEAVCAAITDNLHSNPQYAVTGVPCVRSPDVGWGTLNLEKSLKTDEPEYRRRTVRGEPQPDDIVLVREGGGTGKAAIVLPNQRFSLGQRVMMLRPDKKRVVPKFFLYQLLSPLIQEDHIRRLCKGSASPHLNIGALRKFPFLTPPLPDQRRIVAHLDDLQKQMDTLKALQAETSTELDALMPSILDKAFRGEL